MQEGHSAGAVVAPVAVGVGAGLGDVVGASGLPSGRAMIHRGNLVSWCTCWQCGRVRHSGSRQSAGRSSWRW